MNGKCTDKDCAGDNDDDVRLEHVPNTVPVWDSSIPSTQHSDGAKLMSGAGRM